MKRQIDFTQGNIIKCIICFSIPIVLGELLQNLYNSVDALVVGNLVSKNALAAVTVSSMISNMLVNFFNGMSVGSNVAVAKTFGKGTQTELQRSVKVTISFAVVLGVSLSCVGIVFTPQLLRLAGTQPEYYSDALVYLRIYLAGLMFTVIYNNGAGVLRAIGDSGTPFKILLISCGTNIVLDLLLVGVFSLGIAGVGLATVFSQGLSVILAFHMINKSLRIRCIDFREMWKYGKEIIPPVLDIGIAAGMQSALVSFSNIFVARYMNLFSTASVAGIGIAQRLDKFIVLPAKSFGITMTTCVGQNIGANRYDRIYEGKNKCLLVAVTVTLGLSTVVYCFSERCVALFNSDPAVVSVGVAMMRILIPFFWMMAVREVLLGVLRGCGKSRIPMILSLIGMVGMRQVFLATTMRQHQTIENIYYCYPVAWVTTLVLLVGYYFVVRNRLLVSEKV